MSKFKLTIWIGCGTVVLLVATFGLLRSQCPSAAERANAIKMEDVENMAKGYQRAQRLQQIGRQLESAPPAERDKLVEAMINEFDSSTQTRIRALPTRGERLDAIRTELEKENAATVARTKAMEPYFWCR